jgi:hypothetical protein
MKLFAAALAVATLAGCGGGLDEKKAATPMNAEPVKKVVTLAEPYRYQPPRTSYIPADLPVVRAEPPKPQLGPAASDEAAFTLEDELGAKPGAFELQPVRGRGYPELKIVVKARRIGEASPPEPVRAICKEDRKCEYRLSKKYAVSLSDDKHLKLVPRGESIALVARAMSMDAPTAVEVRFSEDNQVLGRRRVVLLSE